MFICHHCSKGFNSKGLFCSKECGDYYREKEKSTSNQCICPNCKLTFNPDRLRFGVNGEYFCTLHCIANHYQKAGIREGSAREMAKSLQYKESFPSKEDLIKEGRDLEKKALLDYLDNEMQRFDNGTRHYISWLIKEITFERYLQIVYQNVSTTPPKDEHTCSWKECPLNSEEKKKQEWRPYQGYSDLFISKEEPYKCLDEKKVEWRKAAEKYKSEKEYIPVDKEGCGNWNAYYNFMNEEIVGTSQWIEAYFLVLKYLKDCSKATLWMKTENPMLGCISPEGMIKLGRGEKLINFIKDCLEENKQ